jgi:hypothetical protein
MGLAPHAGRCKDTRQTPFGIRRVPLARRLFEVGSATGYAPSRHLGRNLLAATVNDGSDQRAKQIHTFKQVG